MKRSRITNFGNAVEVARSAGSKGAGLGGALISTGKKKSFGATNAAKQLGTKIGKVAGTKGGKAGMALAGLAAAGGLGVAGMKALGARKKKANSLSGKVKKALNSNSTIQNAGVGLSKRLTKMGIKN